MESRFKQLLTAIFFMAEACTILAAEPTITVSARQRYPWNGLVDVNFTIGADEADGGYADPEPGDDAIPGRRLKYVRSAGTVQLDTGIVPGSKNTIELKLVWEDNPAKVNECLFCARGSGTLTASFTAFLLNGDWRFDYNSTAGATMAEPKPETGVPIVIRDTAGSATVNGVTVQSHAAANFTVGGPLSLFASYVGAPGTLVENYFAGWIYYLKIFGDDDKTLLHDFVPWEKDGVAGLYDMVAGRFVVPNVGALNGGVLYDTSFVAKDVDGGTNLTLKTLYKSNGVGADPAKETLLPGNYSWVWDAQADLGVDTDLPQVKIEVTTTLSAFPYSVKFNANGGTGTMANESFTYGTAKALTANAFTRTGYTFQGWATSASGAVVYNDKQSVSNLATASGVTVNLYAVWKGVLPVSSGLVAYYPFDGDSKDKSGKGRHLSGSGITWRSDHKGVSGKAASFPGGKALSYNGQLGCTNSMSFVCWVNPTANSDEYYPDYLWATDNHVCLGRINGGLDWQGWPLIIAPTVSKGVGLAVGTKMVNVFQNAGNFDCLLSKYQTISGKWTHVAVTISSRGAPILYINGSKISASSAAFVESRIYVATPFVVGGGNIAHAGMWFKGGLDELAVYNRALSAEEVKTLYDQTK